MDDDCENDRLEPAQQLPGGLQLPKRPSKVTPQDSKLGLDKLAAEKRKENALLMQQGSSINKQRDRHLDQDRHRDREINRYRDRDRYKDEGTDRDRHRDQNKYRDRNRDSQTDKDRDRDRHSRLTPSKAHSDYYPHSDRDRSNRKSPTPNNREYDKDGFRLPTRSRMSPNVVGSQEKKAASRRHYREKQYAETPSGDSHGGLNVEALQRRRRDEMERGGHFHYQNKRKRSSEEQEQQQDRRLRADQRLGKTPSRMGWDGKTPQRKSEWDQTPQRQGRKANVNALPLARWSETPMTGKLPSYQPDDYDDDPDLKDKDQFKLTETDLLAMKEEEERMDREWYLQDEESGRYLELENLPDSTGATVEMETARQQAKRLSARAVLLNEDASRWEELQLKFSGAHGKPNNLVNLDNLNEESGPRVALVIKDVIPPFLEGQVEGAGISKSNASAESITSMKTVLPVKDPTSDMAVIARSVCQTIKLHREKKSREQGRVKYWELGKTAAGAKAKEAEEARVEKAEAQIARLHEGEEETGRITFSRSLLAKNNLDSDAKIVQKLKIDKQRKTLPVYTVKDDLLQVIRDNQIVVIVGETGSGKTTQLTQYLKDDGYTNYGMIGCTQPRRVAAVSVAQRVAEEVGVSLGEEVGYTIRFEDCTCESTLIKYMTDGILLRETLSDPDLEKYSCIIMDEAHERALNTDVLLGILRQVAARRRDIRIIVTSATMDAEKFSDFFGGIPVFYIPGRTYPVDIFFSKTLSEDYVDAAVKQVIQIHLQAPIPGDVLVFMTGQEDIETTCEVLAERLEAMECPRPLIILPMYSALAADLQAKIFDPAPEGTRKVIVATNIAETSLTVDGIKYVVDSGYSKLKAYNPRLGMDALLVCPTSKASANQRSGRAGRTGPGKGYRLYTELNFKNELFDNSIPEIQRTNLGQVVLLLKSLSVNDVLEFPFMDPPPAENVIHSMYGLWALGALDSGGNLTEVGRRMSIYPTDPPLSSILIAGDRLGCAAEVLTIVSMLSVPSVFYRPHGRESEADAAREKFFVPESDHLTLLHVFQRWKAAGMSKDWCNKYYINGKGMKKASEVRVQLLEVMKQEGIDVRKSTCGTDWDVVRKAICSAYLTQTCRMKGIGEYINMRTGVQCSIHPTSALYGLGYTPDYVVYHELMLTNKEYMTCVTAVEPQWLAEIGPKFYSLKEGTRAERELAEQRERDRLRAEAEESERQKQQEEDKNRGSSLSSKRGKGARMVDMNTPRRSAAGGGGGRLGM